MVAVSIQVERKELREASAPPTNAPLVGSTRSGSWAEPFSVLLIEDNDLEIAMIRKTLRRAGLTDRPYVVRDGRVALELLRANGATSMASGLAEVPDVILLNLELARTPGIALLRRIRQSSWVADVPVIALARTLDEATARFCMDLGVCMYLTTPLSFVEAMNIVVAVEKHWLALDNLRRIGLEMPSHDRVAKQL